MTAKEHLLSLRTLEKEAQSIMQRKLEVYHKLRGGSNEFDDIKVQTPHSNSYEDKIIEFCDTSMELDEAERKLNRERQFAEAVISEISKREERMVLRYYYVIGIESHDKVGDKIGYSGRHVRSILRNAERNYEKLFRPFPNRT